MNINFQIIKNTSNEIFMGHKIWFQAVPRCDVVSATANAPGFTPLIAVARHFGWDYDMIERAAACNASNKVRLMRSVTPTLMLVPATKGRGDSEELTFNYLDVLHELRPKCLHITHYGFLQSRLPVLEASWVLNRILGQMLPTSLQMITFDIDKRRSEDFYRLMSPSLPKPDDYPWA